MSVNICRSGEGIFRDSASYTLITIFLILGIGEGATRNRLAMTNADAFRAYLATPGSFINELCEERRANSCDSPMPCQGDFTPRFLLAGLMRCAPASRTDIGKYAFTNYGSG